MLNSLMLGLPIIIVCLFFQSILLLLALRFYVKRKAMMNNPGTGYSMLVLAAVMLLLVFGNLVQTGIWATLFLLLSEFNTFESAFYHSLVNFTTLGYGDLVMSTKWRLLGSLEAMNGIAMVGVSTSALMWTFQDSIRIMFNAQNE